MRLLALSALLAPLVAASLYDHDLYARDFGGEHDLYARGFEDGQRHAELQRRRFADPSEAIRNMGKNKGSDSAGGARSACTSQCGKKLGGSGMAALKMGWKANAAGMNSCIDKCMHGKMP